MRDDDVGASLRRVGAQMFVRGWLSANNIVFAGRHDEETTVVDTSYFSHADLTLQLVDTALAGGTLHHIVNTHLHSDHCGGNRALQERFPNATTAVPEGFRPAVDPWNEASLSFRDTGQRCPAFRVDHFIAPGQTVLLGSKQWQVHAAPGHDPHAVMLYEPEERLLISGDALWERRLAIIFPELTGGDGFSAAHRTLDSIERLRPRCVLPGHGDAFSDVVSALRASRERLDFFASQPDRHRAHAARALAMFHMLECQTTPRHQLEEWMVRTPIFQRTLEAGAGYGHAVASAASPHEDDRLSAGLLAGAARQVVDTLLADKALRQHEDHLFLN